MQAGEQQPRAATSDGESESTIQPSEGAAAAATAPSAPTVEGALGVPEGAAAAVQEAAAAVTAAPAHPDEAAVAPVAALEAIAPGVMNLPMGAYAYAMEDPSDKLNGYADMPENTYSGDKPSSRKRVPTAAATAAGEQAQAEANARGKPKRKKVLDDGSVSRTTHGGVKIGGRAVTWVGGAGIARETLDKMGIPQLRAIFLKTFMHPTGSNNAEWLRKKLSQVPDPTVGAARAAVPRARDVTAEIWSTGTGFKGFTKQERFRLQQMGGNCEAKVVEVVGNEAEMVSLSDMHSMPLSKGKKKGHKHAEYQTMQIIGQEKFEMPPPKRLRGNSAHHNSEMSTAALKAMGGYDGLDPSRMAHVALGPVYDPVDGSLQAAGQAVDPSLVASQWRDLEYKERLLLQAGMNVKVYRADENWHHGSLQKVTFEGTEEEGLRMLVTIYYWEHDQSETRDISEFFRGEANSLIQWQAPAEFAETQNLQLEDPAIAVKAEGKRRDAGKNKRKAM